MAGVDEWITVTHVKPQSADADDGDESGLTKQQLKNKKRSERRKERSVSEGSWHDNMQCLSVDDFQASASPPKPNPPQPRHSAEQLPRKERRRRTASVGNSSDEEAVKGGHDEDQTDTDSLVELQKKIRKLDKALRAIGAAQTKHGDDGAVDAQLLEKMAKASATANDLESARSAVLLVEDRLSARAAVRAALRAATLRKRHSEASLMLEVDFDSDFACPICTEVVEAAVSVPRACAHIFCRGCLEDHVEQAAKPADCVCPMCRAPLCDAADGFRVDAKPALLVRSRLKHRKGRCHCGADVYLSALRDHLRACGSDSGMYPLRRKFGHEFKQPRFARAPGKPKPKPPQFEAANYDERMMLQAALLASVHDR
ncbi:hypothetical protein M885DRAFT_517770 [Pelagophyceae sp. CCMP2097]|nr:hypothetical protein M885DRAFT_517770 [Pelagophyceae sp. CCMP2097]|mmetsp:Transcript_13638/g.45466  ORF Transcript_13638/g.45466 Transcript_13638/m.45466 type:complete len:371 (+) Transcript_13638:64-1176(+)